MRKFLIAVAALSTVAGAAAPAAAQYYPQGRSQGYNQYQGQDITNQLAQLSQRIDRAYHRRLISANEARRLERELDQVDRLFDRYARNGLSQGERYDIQNRIQNLRQRIRYERQEGRYDQRSDRYEDRYGDRYDDRWDD